MSSAWIRQVINEEHAMRNLIIDGAAGGDTKIRHDVTFLKSYQNKWVILGHELTENNVRK
jgi:hypothetical protein